MSKTNEIKINSNSITRSWHDGARLCQLRVKLNGIIGFAPYFAFTFPGIHESYEQFVGKERLSNMQPVRTALNAGAIIGTGTDWSSLPQDPWPQQPLLRLQLHVL